MWRRIRTDGSYLSASDSRAHFGLGNSLKIDRIIVEWPDGSTDYRIAPAVDRLLSLRPTKTP